MKNHPPPDEQVFLFVTHMFSEDIIKEFKKLQLATKELGPSYILYHASNNQKINPKILDLPHFICTRSSIANIGYPTYSSNNSLVPGSSHFLLMEFYRKHPYKNYWFIEYDVRFTGNWKDFFNYFNSSNEDLLTTHIRKHEEQSWVFWNSVSHPTEKIETSKLLRSFNPIFRISLPAAKYIDKKYQDKWRGHYELTLPTFLHNAGFKIRDFGGIGQFTHPEDVNKFYVESTGDLHDDICMRFKDPHLWIINKPRNKLIHPVKPGEKRLFLIKKIKKLILIFFLFDEDKYQSFKRYLFKLLSNNKISA